jgi:ubiquinone/menaquinone biosynthesis C-methylase UbiE
MKNTTYIEPSNISVYIQKALRPLSKRFYFTNYVNSLPLRIDDKVLEFGSGVGTMAGLLVNRLPKGELTCVDLSRRYLSATKKHLKDYANASFLSNKLVNFEKGTKHYDAINIHFALSEVLKEERAALLAEMFELLRPGGKVFLREPIRSSHAISESEIKHVFRQAGFYPLSEKTEHNRIMGEVFTACYGKISTIQFFFS